MHYLALASDYDGTIAKDGKVDERTIQALERVKSSVMAHADPEHGDETRRIGFAS